MKNLDISTTPLSELLSGLESLANNNAKSAAGRKAKGPKRKPPPPDKRPQVFRTRWENQAIVMHLVISDCTCCGHQFTAPESGPLLRRTNPTVGTHYKEIAPGETYPDLPHETITRYTQVLACHLCFPICSAIESMRPTTQLTLSFPPLREDKYLTPPPPPEGRPAFTQPRAKPFPTFTPKAGAHHRPHDPEVTLTSPYLQQAYSFWNGDFKTKDPFYTQHPDLFPPSGGLVFKAHHEIYPT